MKERCRITIQVGPEQKEKIEAVIKREYPRMKTISHVVRAALQEFLEKENSW
jgi:Arc/MetJ-type ribon-helix-helix transcriptional regulator